MVWEGLGRYLRSGCSRCANSLQLALWVDKSGSGVGAGSGCFVNILIWSSTAGMASLVFLIPGVFSLAHTIKLYINTLSLYYNLNTLFRIVSTRNM